MEVEKEPVCRISTRERVICVEFSPLQWSKSLLAVGLPSSIQVYTVKFKEELDEDEENEKIELIWSCPTGGRPQRLAWSPTASVLTAPRCLALAVARADHHLTLLTTDLAETQSSRDVTGHSGAINSVSYDGDTGELVASASADCTARVWVTNTGTQFAKFRLSSPGMFVQFDPEDSDVLVVGEEAGWVKVCAVSAGSVTLILRTDAVPLMDGDWVTRGINSVMASTPKGIACWNLDNLQPVCEISEVRGGERLSSVRVCRSHPQLAACLAVSLGPQGRALIVTHLRSAHIPVIAHLKVANGLSWHQAYPYVGVGSDREVLFYKIDAL